MVAWPAELPQFVETAGYIEGQPDLVLRTPMEVGPAKVRRRFTTAPRPFKFSVQLDGPQVQDFEDFVHLSLRGGEEPFDWVHPRTRAAASFRFRKPFTLSPIGGPLWLAAMDLWLLPGDPPPLVDRFLFDENGIWDLAEPPEWPADLPAFLELANLANDQADLVARSDIDQGTPQMRRRSAVGARTIPGSLVLDSDGVDTMQGFFDGALKGGCVPFRWLHPRTRANQYFRQVPPYQVTALSGSLFNASFQIETLDLPDFFAVYNLANWDGSFNCNEVA